MKTRKELKEEYKLKKFRMGVYKISNTHNGKVFIGSSKDLVAAWHAQKLQLEMGIHRNEALQQDWKEYGPDCFTYEILEELKQRDDSKMDITRDLKTLEEMLIEQLQPFHERGYNREP